MIKSLIKIGNADVADFFSKFGFIYVDADERTAPDEKESESTSYAEEDGEHLDPRTVYAPFDYTAKFLIEAPNKDLDNVNAKIRAFNDAIRVVSSSSDVRRKVQVEFFNLLNRVKIVGYPNLIASPSEVYHSNRYGELDFAIVELKIHVSQPQLCDFSLDLYNDVAPSALSVGDVVLDAQIVNNSATTSALASVFALRSLTVQFTNGCELRGKADGGYIYADGKEQKVLTEALNITPTFKSNPADLDNLLAKLRGRVTAVEGSNPQRLDGSILFTIDKFANI